MTSRTAASFFAATCLTALLAACNKAPSAPTAPPTPAAPAAPVAATYQCHAPNKSRDIFMRFGADGMLSLGADANSLQPTGMIVLFDKSGMATWSTKRGSWTETNTFDRNAGTWEWANSSQDFTDSARYDCKPV